MTLTEEGNVLIAEFMGIIPANDLYPDGWEDCSWDWLMLIVEEIEHSFTVWVQIEGGRCIIIRRGADYSHSWLDKFHHIIVTDEEIGKEDAWHARAKTKTEAVWKAVVLFLKLHKQAEADWIQHGKSKRYL